MAGFELALSQGSSGHDGKLETYTVAASHSTLLAPGDVIRLTGTSVDGVSSVDAGSAGSSVTGVIASVMPMFAGENLTTTGLNASTAGNVRCHVDPNLNFVVDVTNGPLTADQVGLNADAIFTAATQSGALTNSNMTLNATGAAATATLQFRIVGLEPNDEGIVDGTRARVRFNNTTTRSGATGV